MYVYKDFPSEVTKSPYDLDNYNVMADKKLNDSNA